MTTVAELLRNKPCSGVFHIHPEASVQEAVKVLYEKRIGALVVLSAGKLVGILSERDFVRKLAVLGGSAFDATVSQLMTAEVHCVGPRDSVQHCLQLMSELRFRHLPVLAEGELIGLLSIGDLVKQTIADQAELIQQLEQYIRGE